jgi:hypothetical protein
MRLVNRSTVRESLVVIFGYLGYSFDPSSSNAPPLCVALPHLLSLAFSPLPALPLLHLARLHRARLHPAYPTVNDLFNSCCNSARAAFLVHPPNCPPNSRTANPLPLLRRGAAHSWTRQRSVVLQCRASTSRTRASVASQARRGNPCEDTATRGKGVCRRPVRFPPHRPPSPWRGPSRGTAPRRILSLARGTFSAPRVWPRAPRMRPHARAPLRQRHSGREHFPCREKDARLRSSRIGAACLL